ncbi:hypothetical protein CROQUDRAFT_663920 [Cronartium quercuum f. sp. fusiforme G11]|uniref:Uncharacterized protein n=1 Tax=Cronartium quercuum f. sp. fusiforme G11 TaxID=708437 RepID=A0A9P6T8E1_9BASI|nr:hypothetical protein CROQUDRAFT_663920 [Cronartium quercuum f. sp. fusiforme G11]
MMTIVTNEFGKRWVQPYYLLQAITTITPLVFCIFQARRSEIIGIGIPISLLPLLVMSRLRAIRRRMKLVNVCEETLVGAIFDLLWLLANLGFLLIGNWSSVTVYLGFSILIRFMVQRPRFGGPSRIRTMRAQEFAQMVLGRSLSSLTGFSATELLEMNEEQVRTRVRMRDDTLCKYQDGKEWIVLPIWDEKTRSEPGWMDLEALVAKLSTTWVLMPLKAFVGSWIFSFDDRSSI